MNRATKERIARNKRWRATMQTPGFRACYKLLVAHLRAMGAPRVVVPLTFDATLTQYAAHIHYTPIEDAAASLERENARLTRLQWLVWPV